MAKTLKNSLAKKIPQNPIDYLKDCEWYQGQLFAKSIVHSNTSKVNGCLGVALSVPAVQSYLLSGHVEKQRRKEGAEGKVCSCQISGI